MDDNQKTDPKKRRTLSLKEAADLIGVSQRTLYSRTSQKSKKKLPFRFFRFGRLIRFDRLEIERFISGN